MNARLPPATQVLSFYYRYLATAEPLTDVVYGPQVCIAKQFVPVCFHGLNKTPYQVYPTHRPVSDY